MLKLLFLTCLLCVLTQSIIIVSALKADSTTMIWPLPQQYSIGTNVRDLSYPFSMTASPDFNDIDYAIERYNDLLFYRRPSAPTGANALAGLTINVAQVYVALQNGVDESYTLLISDNPSDGYATLNANTFYGALRGLETFSQLIEFNFTTGTYQIHGLPLKVTDAPRFPHRGLLIDTSRHYENIRTLRMAIDSMSYAKFNVLHWHISDHQSFPLHSEVLPRMAMGAYSSQSQFSLNDVRDLVEYARLRGVRVMMEFDTPGHASSWCIGYPEVCPSQECPTPLDPSNEYTFTFMDTLWKELTGGERGQGIVYEDFFHLGGDEVNTSCWTQTPRIQKWLTEQNLTADGAYEYFVDRAAKIILSHGRDPVNWEEVWNHFGNQLDKSTIIQIWVDKTVLANLTSQGYRGILSNEDGWYLDWLNTNWTTMYNNEPYDGIVGPDAQKNVIGGEACMWGETVDASDIFNTIWPRAAAVAERLWSPQEVNDTDAALPRLAWFRCLLNSRGIGAAPVLNPDARMSPPQPGSCLSQ
jgi:hexosaminidase